MVVENSIFTWKAEVTEVPAPPVSKELKRRWSYFIRKVYETDPLVCPKKLSAISDQLSVKS